MEKRQRRKRKREKIERERERERESALVASSVRCGRCLTVISRVMSLLRASGIFGPKIGNIFSVLSVFKYNRGKTNNKFISYWSFLSSDIPMNSKRRRIIVYTVWSLVTVRETVS